MRLQWLSEHRGLLVRQGVLRQALRIELMEQAISEAGIPLPPPQESAELLERFWQKQQLPPPQRPRWLAERDLDETALRLIVSRPQRWQQWCRQQWGEKLGTLFLRHKDQLDVATASILRVEEQGLAREIYLQLAEQESDFAAIAQRYCSDHPQRQGGQLGPKPLSQLPAPLADLIRSAPVGQLQVPQRLGPADWVVLRVESFQSSRLDDPGIEQRLLQLEADAWLEERIAAWLRRQATLQQSRRLLSGAAQPWTGQG